MNELNKMESEPCLSNNNGNHNVNIHAAKFDMVYLVQSSCKKSMEWKAIKAGHNFIA